MCRGTKLDSINRTTKSYVLITVGHYAYKRCREGSIWCHRAYYSSTGGAEKNMGLSAISREMTAKTKHDHSFTKFIFTLRVLTRYISENFQCNSRPIQYIASLELCYFPIAKLI